MKEYVTSVSKSCFFFSFRSVLFTQSSGNCIQYARILEPIKKKKKKILFQMKDESLIYVVVKVWKAETVFIVFI